MTKDEALTMIIASIAMEELALSHIINAEGEKLQYVLGTLPGEDGPAAGPEEILAVNKSVTELLDVVMQSQMLLKGKMEKALEAAEGTSSCPCGTACQKSAIQLASRCNGYSRDDGFLFSWSCQGCRGGGIRWDEETPALVRLDTERAYALNYTINIRGPYRGGCSGAVVTRLAPSDAFSDTLPLYFSARELECEPLTLHCSATLFPRAQPEPWADLSLLLRYRGSLFVERASLSIVEL